MIHSVLFMLVQACFSCGRGNVIIEELDQPLDSTVTCLNIFLFFSYFYCQPLSVSRLSQLLLEGLLNINEWNFCHIDTNENYVDTYWSLLNNSRGLLPSGSCTPWHLCNNCSFRNLRCPLSKQEDAWTIELQGHPPPVLHLKRKLDICTPCRSSRFTLQVVGAAGAMQSP